jgi:hypothetical protein
MDANLRASHDLKRINKGNIHTHFGPEEVPEDVQHNFIKKRVQ